MQVNAESATMLRAMLLGSAVNEQKTTSKVMSAIPDENHDYRPDPKSKTAIELASHICSSDIAFLEGVAAGAFDFQNAPKPEGATGSELAKWYDAQFAASAAKVSALDGESLAKEIDFFGVFKFPAVMYLSFLGNHMIHHRGQLSTYLRAMGGKCPSIYGGSADEPFQAAAAAN